MTDARLPAGLRRASPVRRSAAVPQLDSLRADAVFGWRQLNRRKTASAVAILSLGLAMGACVAAFRLIDELFLRPPDSSQAPRARLLGMR